METTTWLYVGWEEVIVSNEKGKREVNYYLKRRDGKASDLAVIGKERSIRHMFYHFAHSEDEDVNTTNPSSNPVISSFVAPQNVKLKSRREVLDWLSSVVSGIIISHLLQLAESN